MECFWFVCFLGRPANGQLKNARAGSRLKFFNGNHLQHSYHELIVEVVAVHTYNTAQAMLEIEDFSEMTPELHTKEESVQLYNQLYPHQPMMAIHLRVVSYEGYPRREGSVTNLMGRPVLR